MYYLYKNKFRAMIVKFKRQIDLALFHGEIMEVLYTTEVTKKISIAGINFVLWEEHILDRDKNLEALKERIYINLL